MEMKGIFSLIMILMNLAAPAADIDNTKLDTSVEMISTESIAYDYEVSTFSYEKDLDLYKVNEPGVKYDGFKNTSEVEISNSEEAVERAKNECTIKYNEINVYYDDLSDIWMVLFGNNVPGGCQSVYLNSSGVTCLIVYGE